MKTVYLLPCACGRRLEVDVGQAGTQIECSCGQSLAVPSIRGLKQLEEVANSLPEEKPRPAWSAWRGAAFSLGLLLAVISLAYAAYNAYWYYASMRLADPAEFALSYSYGEIDSLAPVDALAHFRNEESAGLGVPNEPPWVAIDKLHSDTGQRAIVSLIVAGLALVATAASMMGRSTKS